MSISHSNRNAPLSRAIMAVRADLVHIRDKRAVRSCIAALQIPLAIETPPAGLTFRSRGSTFKKRATWRVSALMEALHELLPRQGPGRRRPFRLRCARNRGGAALGRSRRILGAARAAACEPPHGRPVRVLRSLRSGGIQERAWPRCPATSAHRAVDAHLPLRRRDHSSRQPRREGGDPSGRSELDDRRTRHRAFGAHCAGASGRWRAAAWPAVLGRHAEREGRDRSGLCASRRQRAADGERRGEDGAHRCGLDVRHALAAQDHVGDTVRRCLARCGRHDAARCRVRGARHLYRGGRARHFRRQVRAQASSSCSVRPIASPLRRPSRAASR